MTFNERNVIMGQVIAVLHVQHALGQRLDIVQACKTLALAPSVKYEISLCFADLCGKLTKHLREIR